MGSGLDWVGAGLGFGDGLDNSIFAFIRAQIICDTSHLSAHGYMDPALAAEVVSWYQDTQEEFVVIRAYNECVHNMEVERTPRRI